MTASLLLLLAGSSIVAVQVRSWVRSSANRPDDWWPARTARSGCTVAGQAPCRMTIGVGTRLLGPSVFLDLLAASNPAGKPLRTWLTPLDAPARQFAGGASFYRVPGARLVRDWAAFALA